MVHQWGYIALGRLGDALSELIAARPWLGAVGVGGDASREPTPSTVRALLALGEVNLVLSDAPRLPTGEHIFALFDAKHAGGAPGASAALAPYQVVNHFPNSAALINKAALVRAVHRGLAGAGGSGGHAFDATPLSFYIRGGRAAEADSPIFAAFAARFSACAHGRVAPTDMHLDAKHCTANVWVVKPASEGAGGRLAWCSTLTEVKTALAAMRGDCVVQKCALGATKGGETALSHPPRPAFVCWWFLLRLPPLSSRLSSPRRFRLTTGIERPLLIDGRKASLRLFALVRDTGDIYVHDQGRA